LNIDALAQSFVIESLARPGGNVTGLTLLEQLQPLAA